MRAFYEFFRTSLPLTLGIISTLIGLVFLVEFAEMPSLQNLGSDNFALFLIFAIIGIPLTLFGIRTVTQDHPRV